MDYKNSELRSVIYSAAILGACRTAAPRVTGLSSASPIEPHSTVRLAAPRFNPVAQEDGR